MLYSRVDVDLNRWTVDIVERPVASCESIEHWQVTDAVSHNTHINKYMHTHKHTHTRNCSNAMGDREGGRRVCVVLAIAAVLREGRRSRRKGYQQ